MYRIDPFTLGATAALLVLAARPALADDPSPYKATYWTNAGPPEPQAPAPAIPAGVRSVSYAGPQAPVTAAAPNAQASPAATAPAPVVSPAPQMAMPSPQGAPTVMASPQGVPDGGSCGAGGGGCSGFCDCIWQAWENARNGPQMPEQATGGPFGAPVGAPAGAPAAAPGGGFFGGGMGGGGGGGAAATAPGAGMTFGAGGGGAPPGVIGDQMPFGFGSSFPRPGPVGQPAQNSANVVLKGFKIAENQSPRPMDRVFGDFNFYDNVNKVYNRRVNAPIRHVRAYRQVYGFEKTFLGGQASFGLRQSINSINVDTTVASFPGGMHTAAGNLDFFAKYVLLSDRTYSKLLTVGIDTSFPTGAIHFGGYPNIVGFRDTQIQPFLGYLWSQNRWYVQGFSAVNVATDKHDTTLFFNDIAVGYYAYTARNPRALLTAIVPTFETHVNTPLNHRGFHFNDPGSTPDIVDFTFGTTFILNRRWYMTFAYVTPVTGPKPFDYEIVALLNFRFGNPRGGQPAGAPGPALSAPAPNVNTGAPPTSTF